MYSPMEDKLIVERCERRTTAATTGTSASASASGGGLFGGLRLRYFRHRLPHFDFLQLWMPPDIIEYL